MHRAASFCVVAWVVTVRAGVAFLHAVEKPEITSRTRKLRAFDADTGKVLWETTVGGIISVSTITYSVNGKQYVAVMTGNGQSGTGGPLRVATELKPPRGHNAIYVFALPEQT